MCGVGLNSVYYPISVTPCTDGSIAEHIAGMEYSCKSGCPTGTVDKANPTDKTLTGRQCTDVDDCKANPCEAGLSDTLYGGTTKCQDTGPSVYQCTCPSGMLQVDNSAGRVCRSSCTSGSDFLKYDDVHKVNTASTDMVTGMGMFGQSCGTQTKTHYEAVFSVPLMANLSVVFKTNATNIVSLEARFKASPNSSTVCEDAAATGQCYSGKAASSMTYTATDDGFVYFVLSSDQAGTAFGTAIYESASCSRATDLTKLSSPRTDNLPAEAVASTVKMACSSGGATKTRQVLKFLVPPKSTFVFKLATTTDPALAVSMRAGGDTCADGSEQACKSAKDNKLPLSWANAGAAAAYAYVFLEGAFNAEVVYAFEIDTDASVCDGVIDLDAAGGNTMSNFMKVHSTPMPSCMASTIKGKKIAEEVFTMKVPAGVRVQIDLTAFQSSVGTDALMDARWGGACAANSGAGTNSIVCSKSGTTVSWKNDQGQTQPLFLTLEPTGLAGDTSATVVTGTYALNWTKYADACSSVVELGTSKTFDEGQLRSSTSPPPAWAAAYVSSSACHISPSTSFREALYKVQVPSGKTAQVKLTSQSSHKLILEGRFDGSKCPGASTAFCGETASYTGNTNSWYNSDKATKTLYLMVEEAVEGTAFAKPFKIEATVADAKPVCAPIALAKDCINSHCDQDGKTVKIASETTGQNYFKTACCTDGTDCGEEKVYEFTVPAKAKLSVKVTTGSWLAKYELRAGGKCTDVGRNGLAPGKTVVPTGTCFTTGTSARTGDWLTYTNTDATLPEIPMTHFGIHSQTCKRTSYRARQRYRYRGRWWRYRYVTRYRNRCTKRKLDQCQGDCDTDVDCKPGLHCFHRNDHALCAGTNPICGRQTSSRNCGRYSRNGCKWTNPKLTKIPSCKAGSKYTSAKGDKAGTGDARTWDYCYDPNWTNHVASNVFLSIEGSSGLHGGALGVEYKYDLPNVDSGCDSTLKGLAITEEMREKKVEIWSRPCYTYRGTYTQLSTGGVCNSAHEPQTSLARAQERCDNPSRRAKNLQKLICTTVHKDAGRYWWCAKDGAGTGYKTSRTVKMDTGKCNPGKLIAPPQHFTYGQAKNTKDLYCQGTNWRCARYGRSASRCRAYRRYGCTWIKGFNVDRGTTNLASDPKAFTNDKFHMGQTCWKTSGRYSSLTSAKRACDGRSTCIGLRVGRSRNKCSTSSFSMCIRETRSYTKTYRYRQRVRQYYNQRYRRCTRYSTYYRRRWGRRYRYRRCSRYGYGYRRRYRWKYTWRSRTIGKVNKDKWANTVGKMTTSSLQLYDSGSCVMFRSKAKTGGPSFCPPAKACATHDRYGLYYMNANAFKSPGTSFEQSRGWAGWSTPRGTRTGYGSRTYSGKVWRIKSGTPTRATTPSGNTGPARPMDGKKYAYVETSSGLHRYTYFLDSPTFRANQFKDFSFEYYAYGLDVGNLDVQTRNGRAKWTSQNTVLSIKGQQQTTGHSYTSGRKTMWKFYKVAVGAKTQVRFQYSGARGWKGDVAIDGVSFPATVVHDTCADERIYRDQVVAYPKSSFPIYNVKANSLKCIRYGRRRNECAGSTGSTTGKCAHGSFTPKQYGGYYPAFNRYSEAQASTRLANGPTGTNFIASFAHANYHAPPLVPLSGSNNGRAKNLKRCIGECDSDSQCAFGLRCYQRQKGEGVPGCSGKGKGADWDYCYLPAGGGACAGVPYHSTHNAGRYGEAGKYGWNGMYMDSDILTRYTGNGLMHHINVAKSARLQLQVMRRKTTFNYALTIRTTPTAGTCKASSFFSCFINGDKRFRNNGKTTSDYVYYPSASSGASASTTVYVGIQTENTGASIGDGYFLKYGVCRKGPGRAGKWGGADGALCPAGGTF